MMEWRIGEQDERLVLKNSEELQDHVCRMLQLCRRKLKIYSIDFHPAIFNSPSIGEALSALARSSRYVDIELLTLDSTHLVQQHHVITELSKRLSSKIILKRYGGEHSLEFRHLILADDTAYAYQTLEDTEMAHACYNDRSRVARYTEQFEEAWRYAQPDPDLRLIHI